MSEKTTPIVHDVIVGEATEVEKKSRVKRGLAFVKNHKKTTIAVAGLGSLIVAATVFGKRADNSIPDLVENDTEDTEVIDLEDQPA